MSLEAAQMFRQKVNDDPQLQKAVLAAVKNNQPGEIISLGSGHGYEFNEEELDEVARSLSHESELSDFELELVSAGAADNPFGDRGMDGSA